ncbi:MAG: hypothetical protein PHI79_07825 [Sulfurovaceae bacterium]|nr:hypothetical protein [Sulfurovaceae bacterium]MDD5549482.1 hypothetical protein [Sulfurovaceae bacterium]
METSLTTLPFLIILLIVFNVYQGIKNRGKNEESTWTDKYSFTRNMMTAFKRGKYRPWTFLFFFPWFFGLGLGTVFLIVSMERLIIHPPLPLEKMYIKQGTIESIKERKKMDDLLVFKTKDGKIEKYAYRLYESKNNFVGKNVTIFYARGFSSIYTIDNKVYQIIDNNTHKVIDKYSYEGALKENIFFWKFTMWSLIIGFLSGFIMWYANRKELPVHQLNRIKMDAKEKEKKK